MSCNGTYNTYDISDPVELLAVFDLESSGLPHDPEVVGVQVLAPNRILTSYVYGTDVELVKDAAGNYSLITYPGTHGFYYYRWEAEDSSDQARTGAEEHRFLVRYSRIASAESFAAGDGSAGGFDGGTP